ncbi:hypothetical protein [Falsiroseomonas oryziterrae]|uniref:hypothetical protein n=1 Tax=Falsiroseomonas oryziterrae TaxID=2911368 RepID=UPI001F491664|nr:hypothetical protein [Roseomonas sp. NPKOSM-4]
MDHAARQLCWAIHRDLMQAAILRVAALMRRVLRSDLAAQRIAGARPGRPGG